MCYMSKDFREGLDAFLTKRTPQWGGERVRRATPPAPR